MLQISNDIHPLTKQEARETFASIRAEVVRALTGAAEPRHLLDMLDMMAAAIDRWPEGSQLAVLVPAAAVAAPAKVGEVA